MEIALTEKLCPDYRLCIGPGEYLDLPATNIIIFDTNILLSAIFPKKKRKAHKIVEHSRKQYSDKWSKCLVEEKNIRSEGKKIKIVNAIESGEFHKRGIYPAITNSVYGELKYFERVFQVRNIEEWGKKLRDIIYRPILSVEHLRNSYPAISEAFQENADFSVAIASYLLGCNLATDDYRSFNVASNNKFKKIYFDRWGLEKKFLRHDSDSLLMLLR
jgi:hypothetical protein